MTHRQAFGWTIRQHRSRIGKTQIQVADEIGISDSFLCHLELGTRDPTFRVLINISKVFGLKFSQLVQQIEEKL